MWFVKPRMMPGQQPYTAEEQAAVDRLIAGANRAQELCDEDELEEYARQQEKHA